MSRQTSYFSLVAIRQFAMAWVVYLTVFCSANGQVLDASFDPNANGDVNSAIQLTDGKILIGGRFTQVGGVSRNRIARLHSDGTVDLTFNPDVTGYSDPIVRPTDASQIYCMVLQPDGKILIAGDFTHVAGKKQNRVARLHPDGKLDTTFNAGVNIYYYGLIDNTSIHALALQPDGKVIIGGSFASVDDDELYESLARLHPNGSLDTSFNARATSVGDVADIEVLPDGKILVGGYFFNQEVLRLNSNGTADNTFTSARVTGSIDSLAVTPGGQILVNGTFTQISGQPRNSLARLAANGALDASFIPEASSARGLSMQADGSFFVGGSRRNADGSNDVHFTPFAAQYSTILSDGNVLFYGSFTSINGIPRGRIARVLNTLPATQTLTASAAGTIQWERGGSAPEVETVTFEVWDNDSLRWVLCGDASYTSGQWEMSGQELPVSSWIRARGRTKSGRDSASSGYAEQVSSYGGLVADLEVETAGEGILTDNQGVFSFGTEDWLVEGVSKVVTLRNTGTAELTDLEATVAGPQKEDFLITGLNVSSLPVGGSTTFTVTFVPQGAAERQATLMITSNDADEAPFEIALTGTGIHQAPAFALDVFGSYITAMQQADGRILLGGGISLLNGTPPRGLIRVDDVGRPGMPFAITANVNGVTVLPTGKILTSHNSLFGDNRMVTRWNTDDGSRDASFTGFQSKHDGYGMLITTANETFACGKVWRSYPGAFEGFVEKLSLNGSVITSRTLGETVNGLAMQSDGRILAGGKFTYQGYTGLVRLNEDLTVDTSFMGSGSSWIDSLETQVIAVQADGKILIGGSITPVSGIMREGIARLHADGTLDMDYVPSVNGMIESMQLQADGKLLIGGAFTEVNGRRRQGLARLNPDGSLDPQFDPHAIGQVKGLSLQKDGQILVAGNFTQLGHVLRNDLARLPNNISSSQTLEITGTSQIQWMRGGSAAEIGQVTFESWNGTNWVSLGNPIRVAGGWVMNGLSLPAQSWIRARGRAYGGFRNGSSCIVEQIASYGGEFPKITVEVPGETSGVDEPLTVDFGGVFRNVANATVNVTVRNTGPVPLTGLAVQVDGPHDYNFATSALPASLAPGASTTLAVTFAPNLLGARWAALHITSHDLDDSPFDIYLKGIGLNNPPTVTGLNAMTTREDENVTNVPFTIGDVETSAASLVLSATSTNTALVSNNSVSFGGSGTSRTLSFLPRQNMFGTTDITIHVSDGETVTSTTFTVTVLPVNDVPTVSAIPHQIIDEDGVTQALSFVITDVETPVDGLTLSATSTNITLVPHANIVLGGSGANRIVTVTPAPNQFGSATITVRANDGTGTGSRSFSLTVNPVNDAPTLSVISDQTTDEDTRTSEIVFVIGDLETTASALVVTAQSSNTTLVPANALEISGGLMYRALFITPAANRSGSATITVTVSDGNLQATRSFLLTVNPVNDAPTITGLENRIIKENESMGSMSFTIRDPESNPSVLSLTAVSDNAALVPESGIVLGGNGNTRSIVITPAPNTRGVALITLTVSDGLLQGTSSFTLTVADPVTIIQDPLPVEISEGERLEMRVTAEGTGPLQYQWRKNQTPIPAATASWYVVAESHLDDQGTYDVIVTNVAGSVSSLAAIATIHRQPNVQEPPLSQIMREGSSLTLEVSALGRPPLLYQWRKDSRNLPGETAKQPKLVIPGIRASDAGSYSVVISNESPPPTHSLMGHIGVVSPLPATYGVKEGASLTLGVKATAPPGFTISYLWKREGLSLSTSDARITGEDDKTLKIKGILPGEDGTYTCEVTMAPASGDPIVGSAGDCEVSILAKPVLSAITSPAPTLVGETVTLSPLTTMGGMFAKFTAKGLPAGVKLDLETGVFTGKPTTAKTYTVIFTATNAAGKSDPVTVTWVVNPLTSLDGVVGTFYGIIERHGSTNAGLGGFVQITTTTKGAVSGSVTLAGKKYPIKGALDTATGDDTTATLIAKRSADLGNLVISLSIETGSNRLTGSIAEEDSLDAATFTAHRNVWTKINAPAEALVAKYTAGLVTSQTGDTLLPQGDGYATLSVSQTGATKWVGKTGDGAAFTFATCMGPEEEIILHALLYKKTGSLQGLSYINETNGDWFSVQVPPFDWYKQEQAKDRLYRNGFASHAVNLIGGRYEPVNNLYEFLDIASGSNPRLVVEDTVPAFELPLTITAPNKVALLDNPRKMKLAIKAATGIYTGSFTEGSPARKAAISGVLVRNTASSILRGYGYFTIPSTTDKASPTVSSKARIEMAD